MNISYDIAAIVLDMILVLTYNYITKYPFKVYRALMSLVLVSMLSAILDVVSVITIEYSFLLPIEINYVVNIMFYISEAVALLLFYRYILITSEVNTRSPFAMLSMYLPFFADLIFIILSPFTRLIFYFDEFLRYRRGDCNFIVFAFAAYFIIMSAVVITVKIKTLTIKKAVNILVFIITISLFVYLQFLFPNVLLMSFAVSLCLVVFIFTIESPKAFIDNTNSVTTDNFMNVMKTSFISEARFTVILINIKNLRTAFAGMNQDNINEFLRTVTDFMYSLSKETVVCRHGSGCFLLKIDKCSNADDMANLLKQRFSEPWESEIGDIMLVAAIGYISCPKDAKNCAEFIEVLDILSKNVHTSNVTSVAELGDTKRQRAILQAIKDAVINKKFEVYYQPIYSTKKKRITSAEALIRLRDEELGFISPEEFIPIAEKEGYILPIGNFVFEEVCRFFSENDLKNLGIDYIEVNLSVVQCMQYKIAERYLAIMQKYNIKPEYMNLEVTETAAIISYDSIKTNINALCDNGILLSLDDFGTGYSNMSYLYTMPFDYIKVDKCILWSASENEKALTVLKNTFDMAKKLDLKIIMEGVETQEQANLCTELGVDHMQGFFYSKAVDGSSFISFIKNFNGVWECD